MPPENREGLQETSGDAAVELLAGVMAADEVRVRLDRLQDHGFIAGWRRSGRYWVVDYPGAYRCYTRTQIGAFVDGCNAMGAAP